MRTLYACVGVHVSVYECMSLVSLTVINGTAFTDDINISALGNH